MDSTNQPSLVAPASYALRPGVPALQHDVRRSRRLVLAALMGVAGTGAAAGYFAAIERKGESGFEVELDALLQASLRHADDPDVSRSFVRLARATLADSSRDAGRIAARLARAFEVGPAPLELKGWVGRLRRHPHLVTVSGS